MSNKIKQEILELRILFRSIPSPIVTLFAVSVIAMNLLANKSIDLPVDWLALDSGILVSWVSFLAMDVMTKHYGPKAATQISIGVLLLNLLVCLFFYLAGALPGTWGESYVAGSETVINTALDQTISGTWYVLFGSSIAFLTSAVVNNFLNYAIGTLLSRRSGRHSDGFTVYAVRSYISTALGQFCDNLVFALIVSHFFFGWTLLQCITCSVTGMLVELLCEIVFSPLGYRICRHWKREGIGEEYLAYRRKEQEAAA